MKLVDALCLASASGLRSDVAESGMVAGDGAEGVEETERLPSRLDTVDRHPGALEGCVDAAREGFWDEDSEVKPVPGIPKPRAVVKNEDFTGGSSFAGGVVAGSGKVEERSAGGGMGDRE